MSNIKLSYDHSLIDITKLEADQQKLKKLIEKNKITPYNFLNKKIYEESFKIKALKPDLLLVIGIGGSNLATKAIYEAMLGKFYNYKNNKPKIFFADTIDEYYTQSLLEIVEQELKQNKKVVLNIVSKSGTTIEITANYYLFINLLKKYNCPQDQIVVTTDKNSPLHKLALAEKYNILEIPKEIGGRYSAFTPVSLFPLSILGLNTKNLLNGAERAIESALNENIMENPAAISAIIMNQQYRENKNIHDFFVFSPDLESLGSWYRQLCAESLGKTKNVGITPTVSVATTDLHSVYQLYLAGPYDKFTTFIKYESEPETIKAEHASLTFIKNSIFKGVESSYINGQRPFIKILLKEKSEESLGELLMLEMAKIVFLADLLDVNPFDQPAVELYKKELYV